ncbi:MAG: ABC transporter ATP-binding protein [Planctomycetaceae bacterium]|nr:ABC transporter ATP-binding protein [Planctomycetaceae bacterium]
MTHPAIRVEGISKQYQVGLREKSRQTFREAMIDMAGAPLRRLKDLSGRGDAESTFWALRDISFDVPEGEVLGIIGHNGAGKSTLLKILSRITEPTEGRAVVHGRVASLLEVGTGFHNELTGRENIYLNGAILGMSKVEINRKFDEIVSFSGVERFLDTPIKRYSSGMKVRLAFAVAAHLEPEILIIDEVLAVGDQEFQNKCLGKMHDVATSGRTVLFVSHNMPAVEHLCTTAMVLKSGAMLSMGDVRAAIDEYLDLSSRQTSSIVFETSEDDAPPISLHSVEVLTSERRPCTQFQTGEDVVLRFTVKSTISDSFSVGVLIHNPDGLVVVKCLSNLQHSTPLISCGGIDRLELEIPELRLAPFQYTLSFVLFSRHRNQRFDSCGGIQIVAADLYGTGKLPRERPGVWLPRAAWTVV